MVMNVVCEPPVFQQCYLRLGRLFDVYDLTWSSKQIVTAGNSIWEEQTPCLSTRASKPRNKGNDETNQVGY